MKKSKPIRTCVYTRVKKYKNELIRLVKGQNGKYFVDDNQNIQARGIYIDKSEKVLKILEKNKKYSIDIEEINKIIKIIKAGDSIE